MSSILIKNATIVNENRVFQSDLYIKNERIERIDPEIEIKEAYQEINADGLHLIPGAIDDQVHFREPGLTHKGTIASESKAAVAGGVTSYMEMPNTNPAAFTSEILEEKYTIAQHTSHANFSFYLGASNDNYDDLMRIDTNQVCGIKIFMGSSTGNLLVDEPLVLEKIFQNAPTIIATHCEDEQTVRRNTKLFLEKFGENIPPIYHEDIRSREACFLSSDFATSLARKHGTHLHVLHISTKEELELFDFEKYPNITNEACVHHLWFSDADYAALGHQIKCNPAIKTADDREALLNAISQNIISVIATDHAPHTWDEKQNHYPKAPSGLPLVQHSVLMMWEYVQQGRFKKELIVEKMSHAPARLFKIEDRGFIREGYFADLVFLNTAKTFEVKKSNIAYHCGWSPLEGQKFSGTIMATLVNGMPAFKHEEFYPDWKQEFKPGSRLRFQKR